MTRNNDILYKSEYIKNVLYFAITRPGKVFNNTAETYFFSIDHELIYENYYSDFGPLNLGCIYKYCSILNEKLEKCLNNQIIVHYTSSDPKKSANAAFLLGCFGVLYLSLPPKEALKPLIIYGHSYRPFQDATPGISSHTISILDCLQAMDKARERGFYKFQDFNYEEYDRLDKIEGGDLNWIVPGKFLAFIGPVKIMGPMYHRPEEYIEYFKDNNVKIVIRLNKAMYNGNVFNNVGVNHYDLFFPDGSCPPKNILLKFLQISECSDGAIAVHCKAGLGRTGSLIGCYLIKHYRMTSHEAIAWMRICRPGSVIGQQQEWLEQLEPWLIKQGNLYRKRIFDDFDKIPMHEFGLYSITEKALKYRPLLFRKSPSPPLPMHRQNRMEKSQSRPHASKIRGGSNIDSTTSVAKAKCISGIKSPSTNFNERNTCAEECKTRRSNGCGEPRSLRWCSPDYAFTPFGKTNPINCQGYKKKCSGYAPIPTFCTTQGPIVKTINEAKDFLMRSSACRDHYDRQFTSTLTTLKLPDRTQNATCQYVGLGNTRRNIASSFNTVSRDSTQPHYRRRLGRSPSPPQATRTVTEQSRGVNTSSPSERLKRDTSKCAIRDALSRLKLTAPRYGSHGAGSVGAASLGARRVAPTTKRAPSVRSDERPTATQGDILNSIKYQRKLRETLINEKGNTTTRVNQDRSIYKPTTAGKVIVSGPSIETKRYQKSSGPKDRSGSGTSRAMQSRPSSPKARQSVQTSFC